MVDNLERAMAAAEPMDRNVAANHIAEGIRLVYEELSGVLRGAGVESYEPAGEPFDPDWHEAVMTRPADPEAAGTVLEVLERGYRLDGQVVRNGVPALPVALRRRAVQLPHARAPLARRSRRAAGGGGRPGKLRGP